MVNEEWRNRDELEKPVKLTTNYLHIKDGDKYEGVFKGYKTQPHRYNKDENVDVYLIDDYLLTSASAKLKKQMQLIDFDTKIRISRQGERSHTKWIIEVL